MLITSSKRFDVFAEAGFPFVSPRRLALQIRQDMWRRLQRLRGFSPVIEIWEVEGGLRVKAGGQVEGRFPKAYVAAQIADLLEDRSYRERWIRYARRSSSPDRLSSPAHRRGVPVGREEQGGQHA